MSRPTAALAALPASPLDTLHAFVAPEMAATNEMILARLDSPVETIPAVARHLIESGGKRIRPLLTLACAALYNQRDENAVKLAASVEFIHSATLLHDDVVDGSPERRGKIAANLVYGNKAAVLVGDFLFSRAFELMVETGSIAVLGLLSRASAIIAEGEVLQLKTANNLSTTMDDYLEVVSAKTAALFAAAAACGPALAGADQRTQDALYTYGHHLGVAFQIADDILDYTADRAAFGKQQGNDFAEGKMTAPVIAGLDRARGSERAFWQRTMADRTQKPEDFAEALSILNRHDCFGAAQALAETHRDLAARALAALPETPVRRTLADLAAHAVTRAH